MSYFNGLSNQGQDFVPHVFNSSADLTPSGTGVGVLDTSIAYHNYSGAAVYVLGANATPAGYLQDAAGKASAANIKISGVTGSTINGSTAAITISADYGIKHWQLFSGTSASGSYLVW